MSKQASDRVYFRPLTTGLVGMLLLWGWWSGRHHSESLSSRINVVRSETVPRFAGVQVRVMTPKPYCSPWSEPVEARMRWGKFEVKCLHNSGSITTRVYR